MLYTLLPIKEKRGFSFILFFSLLRDFSYLYVLGLMAQWCLFGVLFVLFVPRRFLSPLRVRFVVVEAPLSALSKNDSD